MREKHKVLVVDDEDKIIEVLEAYLKQEDYEVLTAQSGSEALDIFKHTKPSAIILDLMLPDISGEKVCQEIRKVSDVPIIMLTAKTHENSILKGFDYGADDYVTKPFSAKQLIARLKALLKRAFPEDESDICNYYYDDGNLVVKYSNNEIDVNNNKLYLTPIEYKILTTLIKHKTKIFTREELISLIYNDKYDGFDRTIDAHIKNLRQKIDNNGVKYIVTVYGIGYKFGGK